MLQILIVLIRVFFWRISNFIKTITFLFSFQFRFITSYVKKHGKCGLGFLSFQALVGVIHSSQSFQYSVCSFQAAFWPSPSDTSLSFFWPSQKMRKARKLFLCLPKRHFKANLYIIKHIYLFRHLLRMIAVVCMAAEAIHFLFSVFTPFILSLF
jgi:hypothetical protein